MRTPPGSETGTEWVGVQDQVTKLFNIQLPDLLHIWQTDAQNSTEVNIVGPQMTVDLIF